MIDKFILLCYYSIERVSNFVSTKHNIIHSERMERNHGKEIARVPYDPRSLCNGIRCMR